MATPVGVYVEKLGDVDIAHDVVDILLIDHNLRKAGTRKEREKVVARCAVLIYCYYLVARTHALPYGSVFEVDGVAEDLHFIVHILLLLLPAMELLFEIVVELIHRYQPGIHLILLYAEKPHEAFGDEGYEFRHRIEHNVDHIEGKRKHPHHEVGVDPEGGLRDELSAEKNHQRGEHRIRNQHHRFGIAKPALKHRIDQHRKRNAVDYEHYIIAHEERGDEHILVVGESLDDTVYHSASRSIDLHADLVGLHISDLHPREEGGEDNCQYRDYQCCCERHVFCVLRWTFYVGRWTFYDLCFTVGSAPHVFRDGEDAGGLAYGIFRQAVVALEAMTFEHPLGSLYMDE